MDELSQDAIPRAKAGTRLAYTIFFLVILNLMIFIIQLTAVVQYAMLLVSKSYSEPLRSFSNKAAAYVYRLARYITLNENLRPFPFGQFPQEMDGPESPARFD